MMMFIKLIIPTILFIIFTIESNPNVVIVVESFQIATTTPTSPLSQSSLFNSKKTLSSSKSLKVASPLSIDSSSLSSSTSKTKGSEEVSTTTIPTNGSKTVTIEEEDGEGEGDTLLKFSKDIHKVLQGLRKSETDPTIPEYLVRTSSRLSYSQTWTLEDWEKHNSRTRYIRYLIHFPNSRLLRRIIPHLSALFLWTMTSVWIDNHFVKKPLIPLSALGTISTFLAFLLTLRSNQGLSRLDEARKIWSKVVLYTREMSSLISSFVYPVDKELGIMLVRHVSLFGWLLKSELRVTKQEHVADLVNTMLPNNSDATYVLSQRQKAVAVVTRIRQVIHHLSSDGHRLSTAEEIALDHTAQVLSEIITATGRIRATPIPTMYTSHASRLLVFYLFCLPPALHCSGLDAIMTTVITMVVGYAMLGLDEISHMFEQPFRVIPMYQISKRSMLAAADTLTCRPPPLINRVEKSSVGSNQKELLTQKELTSYWSDNETNGGITGVV